MSGYPTVTDGIILEVSYSVTLGNQMFPFMEFLCPPVARSRIVNLRSGDFPF